MHKRVWFAVAVAMIAVAIAGFAQTIYVEDLAGNPVGTLSSNAGLFRVVIHDSTAVLPDVLNNVLVVEPLNQPAGSGRLAPDGFDQATVSVYETAPGSNVYRSPWLTLQQLANLANPGDLLPAGTTDLIIEVFPGDSLVATYTSTATGLDHTATVCIHPELWAFNVDYSGDLADTIVLFDWGENATVGANNDAPGGFTIDGVAHGLAEDALVAGQFEPAAYAVGGNFTPGDTVTAAYNWTCGGAALALTDTFNVATLAVDRYNAAMVWQDGYDLVSDALNDPATADGDTIQVWDGTYVDDTWSIDHDVTIESRSGDASAVTVQFNAYVGVGSAIPDSWVPDVAIMADGITIQHLTLDFDGGGATAFNDHERPGGGIITKDTGTGVVDGPQADLTIASNVIHVGNTFHATGIGAQCCALQIGVEGDPHNLQFVDNEVHVLGVDNITGFVGNADGVFINPHSVAAAANLANEPMVIDGNTFVGNVWHGVYVCDAAYVEITNNVFNTTTVPQRGNDAAIKIRATDWFAWVNYDQTDILVEGNTCSGNGRGVYVFDGSTTTVQAVDVFCNLLTGNHIGAELGPDAAGRFRTNTLDSNHTGVYWVGGTMGIRYNNYEGNTDYGLVNATGIAGLDALFCWWGDVSGPEGPPIYGGTGDKVTSNLVDADPWFYGEIGCGLNLLDHTFATGTVLFDTGWTPNVQVAKTGVGTPDMTLLQLDPFGASGLDPSNAFYFDLWMPDVTDVDELEIRLYTTDPTIEPRWYDGTGWIACSDWGYDAGGGYVWITINALTTPSLADLTGTAFGFGTPTGPAPTAVVAASDVTVPVGGAQNSVVSVAGVPAAGLADLQGQIAFDPTEFQITGAPTVLPVDYALMSSTAVATANATGVLAFSVSNNTGAGYIIGNGDVLSVPFQAIGAAGDTCALDLTVDVLRYPDGSDIAHTVTNGTATIQVVANPGDVNNDGVVDITDARLAAEHAIGVIDLTVANPPTWPAGAFDRADVAPPIGVVDITDARWIAEAGIGIRTLSLTMAVVPQSGLSTASVELNAFGEVAISGSSTELADVQGVLYYDADEIEITAVFGINGFEVLAYRIDDASGVVRFAAAKLGGGSISNGPIVAFETNDDLSAAVLSLDVLRNAGGQDIPFEVLNAGGPGQVLEFGCTPNPVDDVHTTYFSVKGTTAIDQIRVYIYDFFGQLMYDSGWGPNDLAWHVNNDAGDTLANGVYYYRMEVLFVGADEPVVTGIGKVAIYR